MIVHLPWESVEGPKYAAKDAKVRKKWVVYGGWVMALLLILCGIATGYYMVALFGVLYVLALAMQKDAVVTTRGLEIYYQMRITTHYDFWGWDEINAIVREERNHPELVALHIGMGNKEKCLYFTRSDAEQIIKLAKQRNSAIRVVEAGTSGRPSKGKKRK